MIYRYYAGFCLFLCVFAMSMFAHKQAHADLMILPSNVIFEGRDRYADVTLINNGNDSKYYQLGWSYNRMLPETGVYEHLESFGDEFDLSKHLVLSPKRVRLEPKAKQKIRIALRRPAEIAPGDYHVHLRFSALPAIQGADVGAEGEGKAAANVNFVISYAIPVILRVGEDDVKVELGQITLERNPSTGKLEVLIPVKRSPESPYSILGYFMIYHVDEDGNEEFVGELSNANIFPEIDNRTFRALLTKEVTGGSLRVVLNKRKKEDTDMYVEKIYPLE